MRAVQLHYYEPDTTSYVSNTLEPLLRYMSDKNTDCGHFNKVQQQFNACRWAINQKYGSYNDLLAAALFNDVGIAPDFSEHKMKGSSSHVITPTQDGIIIEFSNRYPVSERMKYGMEPLVSELDRWKRTKKSKPLKHVMGLAMKAFYVCGDYRLSIDNELRRDVYNAYKDYLHDSKCFGIGSAEEPTFENPIDMLEAQTIILPYEDFIKEGVSDKQLEQRRRNTYNMCYEATMQKAARLPKEINLFTTQQLKSVGLYSTSLANAQKDEYGIIEWVEWGKYRFASDFWQEVCCDTPEAINPAPLLLNTERETPAFSWQEAEKVL